MSKRKFRFQDLEIWQNAIAIADEMFDTADIIDQKRMYRLAEQLRSAALSISNNIAEGSGSSSNKDFANFLNFAHRSAFETANITIILKRRSLIDEATEDRLLNDLDLLCRKITNFKKSLSYTKR